MADKLEDKIIYCKTEFKGWHKLETITVQHRSLEKDVMLDPITREVYLSGTVVSALLYIAKKDQILLNQQFRIGAFVNNEDDPYLYECPAGALDDDNEDFETAVRREVKEETNCIISDIEFIGKVYPSPGGSDEVFMLYCGCVDEAKEGFHGIREEGEEIKTHIFDASKAIKMLDDGKVSNSATVILLHWFARNHERLKKKWGNK